MRLRLALLLAWSFPAFAQSPAPSLAIEGHVQNPRSYALADLAKLPQIPAEISGRDGAPARHVTGVLLWPLLQQAGWVDAPGRKTHLRHVVLARGRDGYEVALSIAELDPAFEGKQVIAVLPQGAAKNGIALFVPGDAKAGRRVHDLIALDVE